MAACAACPWSPSPSPSSRRSRAPTTPRPRRRPPRRRASCCRWVAAICTPERRSVSRSACSIKRPTVSNSSRAARSRCLSSRLTAASRSKAPPHTCGSPPLSLSPPAGPQPIQGTAHYVPAPGTTVASQPTLTSPSKARGVYELENVTFPSTGVWTASLSFTSDGHPQNLTTDFGVSDEPALPAPGQRAFATKNLTMADANAKPESIDSRAQDGAKIPDPELHQETIAAALAAHQPILALFSTPVWCMSQFCGPSTDALEQLAGTGPQDAAYIHVEIYEDHATNQVNAAAKQWLLRNGSLTEPWLFLIAPDGKIVDRWSPLFQVSEVRAELDRVAR